VLLFSLLGWNVSVKNIMLLNRVVRSSTKTTGKTLPTVGEMYESHTTTKTADSIKHHLTNCTNPAARSSSRRLSERA